MIAKASTISAAAAAVLLTLPHYSIASPTKRQVGPFQPTWESTDQHNPSPEWFKDAKFGIYWHWGVFTVPEYGFEWYPRHMYDANDNMGRHHRATYGDPSVQGGFGYQNFTFGSPDVAGNVAQFKPVRSSEGGEWDPEHWIEVIKASGAKFAGPVAEHHDGYALWDSKFNEWNSAKLGPKLDIVRIFEKLVRDNGMKFMIAMHQAYNTNGFFGFAPQQSDPSLRRLLGQFNHEEGSERWLAKQLEAMDHVKPDMIWNDFGLYSPGFCHGSSDICAIREKERLEFLATYFNRGVEWNQEVLTTYKHFDQGFRDTSAVADWERGGPADLTRPYWLTDEAISASSWSYTKGISYYSQKSMIHSLLDRVAKNGNMLLNISPTAAGVLPAEQETILRGIGAWLQRNGEAIYGTRAWDVYGEGPNRAGGGSFTKPLEGDSRDIRFTRNKDENVLYASVLGWPENGEVKIIHFGSEARVSMAGLRSVDLIGGPSGLQSKHNQYDLTITLPQKPFESDAYVLKLTFAQRIPVPQPPRGVTIWPTKDITDTTKGVTLPEGDFRAIYLEDAGLKGSDITYMRVSGFTKVTVWKAGNLQGEWKDYFEGDHTFEAGTVGSMRIVSV